MEGSRVGGAVAIAVSPIEGETCLVVINRHGCGGEMESVGIEHDRHIDRCANVADDIARDAQGAARLHRQGCRNDERRVGRVIAGNHQLAVVGTRRQPARIERSRDGGTLTWENTAARRVGAQPRDARSDGGYRVVAVDPAIAVVEVGTGRAKINGGVGKQALDCAYARVWRSREDECRTPSDVWAGH